ncbi:glycosyl transferase [Pseudoalteromonas sp. MSK9-3]|uniref:glycosyltransferase family 2 protein n=1 Tax=Pseudoalteromonas sp. MSK9-3 TaxID=1897633 RepID=UPI000E6B8AD8|nr:glycosyltransferase family 2 protein [Pseudoalteromonas sp. MSK9-3]RJE75704.1 glycosyl transferase [Pseudoalteromonas sp. MSK9-3]
MSNISVIILTLNESKHIERCILSLKPFTQRIFVIDSGSSDLTIDICKRHAAKCFHNPWPGNHAKQFQWALDNCPIETTWVMKMDADEFATEQLTDEINSQLSNLDENVSGVYVKRKVCFMGKWIKYGGYYPTWLLRIWRFEHGRMEQRWMDEHIKLTQGNTVNFEYDIVDDNLNNLTWWTEKHNNYATKEAADLLNTIYGLCPQDGVRPSLRGTQEQRKRKLKHIYAKLPLFVRPFIYFIWRFVFKLGFLDGKKGLIWHFLQGFWYRFLVDAKIYDIKRLSGNESGQIIKILRDKYGINFEK